MKDSSAVAHNDSGERKRSWLDSLRALLARLRRAKPPPSPPSPPAPDPVRWIREAQQAADLEAMIKQRKRTRFAVVAAILAPPAVLLVAVQALLFSDGGPWAVALICGEVLTLAVALAFGFLQIGLRTHRDWIRYRLVAEILRREERLFLARVGPYLRTGGASAELDVRCRLLEIESRKEDPVRLLGAQGGPNKNWRDELEDSKDDDAVAPIPDLGQCLHDYREERVVDQQHYFARRRADFEGRDLFFERAAKVVITAALIAAAIHLGILIYDPPHQNGGFDAALVVLAVFLPAVGALFVGLRSLFEYHRLSRSYGHHAETLGVIERRLLALEHDLQSSARSHAEIELDLKRLVLSTEELLSNELRQWWVVVYPEEPTGAV